MQIILIILILFPSVLVLVGYLLSTPGYKGPVSDHFDGKKFFNPGGARAKKIGDVLKWMLTRARTEWPKYEIKTHRERPLKFFDGGIKITLVNHTTFLIQTEKINILTDPVWSERASPFKWIGPKRKREPGISIEDLPRIHLILLTHNHYDHLDLNALRVLVGAHHPQIVVPLGVKAFLDEQQIGNVAEVDWWDQKTFEKLTITSVPAQHFSGRGMFDRDTSLWCGYVIQSGLATIYFAGDTGYHNSMFMDIGRRFANIDLSVIPIGAYKPRWFMSPVHTSPEEAVKIHRDVKSKSSIASHFGTFALSDEGPEDPVSDLQIALQENQIIEDEFAVLMNGQSKIFEMVSE